jgi:hypothetical protein
LFQLAALCAAFWTAVALYARGGAGSLQPVRFVTGLGLGALCAHLGGAFLQLEVVARNPGVVWNPGAGFSVLFVPLGLLVACATSRAFGALPAALAVARVGCLGTGCCTGPEGEPTPLLEIAGWLGLATVVLRIPARRTRPVALAGFGLVRLVTEPLRGAPPLGPATIPPGAIAVAWIAAGAWDYLRSPSPSSRIGRRMLHQDTKARMRV